MKIYVVGGSKNKFLPFSNIRKKFLVDVKHDGDNIDNLNPWYCEMTGAYYLWKHEKEDIVGLEHYRRYFINDNGDILSENEIRDILKDNDIIMYKYIGTSAWHDMEVTKKLPELKVILETVKVFYGDEMYKFFLNKCKTNYVYEGNMFICRKELIDKYFEWLFNILFTYDKFYTNNKNFEKKSRINGYLSEYLFGPYMEYNKKKIYDCKRQSYNKDLTKKLYGHI